MLTILIVFLVLTKPGTGIISFNNYSNPVRQDRRICHHVCSGHVNTLYKGSLKNWAAVANTCLILFGALKTSTRMWESGAGMGKNFAL